MIVTNSDLEVQYCNDIVFKYLLSRDDEDSIFIRNTIIERITGIQPKESIVLNPEIDPAIIGKKSIILDVHIKDERGYEYDIEMQVGSTGKREVMRFEYYGAKLFVNQLDIGDNYDELMPVFQIIFINKLDYKHGELINQYQMRTKKGDEENNGGMIHRIYVHYPQINQIAKEKGILHMSDFEQLCYLFKNNAKDDILKSDERLVRVVMGKFNAMRNDDNLWSMAKAVEMGELRAINRVKDGYDEGKEAGLKEGVKKGKVEGEEVGRKNAMIALLQEYIAHMYHEDASKWLRTLSLHQLEKVSTLQFTCSSIEELQNKIQQ